MTETNAVLDLSVARVNGDAVETPVRTFTKGERTIRLHGAIHVASPECWRGLGDELERLDESGWAIHVEGVRTEPGAELGITARALKVVATDGRAVILLALPELTSQADLRIPARAKRIDLDVNEIEEMMSPLGKIATLSIAGMVKLMSRMPKESLTEALRPNFQRRMTEARPVPLIIRPLARTVLDARNRYAISHAINDSARNVVLVWGLGHLSGMAELLVEEGWREQEVEWRFWAPRVTTEAK